MSLNSLSLPPSLLVAFYQKALVQTSASPVPYLGKNAKNILVLVNSAQAPFLPDAELEFLTTVLSACELDLADVAVVNWQNRAGHSASVILSQLAAQKIILFGIETNAVGLPVTGRPYTVESADGREFIKAPSLSELAKNLAAKKQLWLALKQLFAL